MTIQRGLIPPQALELEESILSSLINEPQSVDTGMELLIEEVFYSEKHRMMFRSLKNLYTQRMPIDVLTFPEQLKKDGNFEKIGGNFEVINISNAKSSGGNIEFHCRLIQEKYFKREVIKVCQNSVSKAYDDTSDIFDVIDQTTKVYDIIGSQIGKDIQRIGSMIVDRIKAYDEVVVNGITGIPSGLSEVDRMTGGWQKSDLIIIAGRPAMGKTALLLTIARNASVEFEKPGVIFELEMSGAQLTDRLISGEVEIESEKIRKRNLAPSDWKRIHEGIGKLDEAPLFIDDTPGINMLQLSTKVKKLKKEHDIQWVLIDYLQLMTATHEKGKNTNREQEISSISRSLKILAKEVDIPIIALSQLSRAVETRPGRNKRPLLSDLRESGSIEQDADMVIFLFRPEYYDITEDENGRSLIGVAELIFAKNRHGPTGTVVARFISKFTKFKDLEDEFEYPSGQFPVYPAEDLNKKHFKSFTIQPNKEFDDEDAPF